MCASTSVPSTAILIIVECTGRNADVSGMTAIPSLKRHVEDYCVPLRKWCASAMRLSVNFGKRMLLKSLSVVKEVEQYARLAQVLCVKPLGKSPQHAVQQRHGIPPSVLLIPKPGKAHGS